MNRITAHTGARYPIVQAPMGGMAAAFALGAEGIQMGTRFVSSFESPVHANHKQAIVNAEATGTLMLNKKSSPSVRALKSERTQPIHDAGLMAADALKGIRQLYFAGSFIYDGEPDG